MIHCFSFQQFDLFCFDERNVWSQGVNLRKVRQIEIFDFS